MAVMEESSDIVSSELFVDEIENVTLSEMKTNVHKDSPELFESARIDDEVNSDSEEDIPVQKKPKTFVIDSEESSTLTARVLNMMMISKKRMMMMIMK